MSYRKDKNQGKKEEQKIHTGMTGRGVNRHMAEKEPKVTGQEHEMNPNHTDHMKHMLNIHHMHTLWVYWLVIILGAWVLLSPFTFSYEKGLVMPSGGREVWLSLEARIILMKWSDIITGSLLIIFGWRSLTPNRPISLWLCCFLGVWLTFAPLIFWSPSPVAYYNDTLIGALVIALTILIPGMPNMMMYMEKGPEIPPGWTYNPSSWPQRWIMIVTAFFGWVVSRYLAAFQLGYIDSVWDPFFGEGSAQVLNSNMSHSLPVSDAGLGALAYTFEFLMGWMGGPARWRTMPWMVTFFGILVIPLGLVHIFLVISQPVAVGHWCTFCLLAAAIMLPMIPLEIDEVFAMIEYLVKARNKGENLWKAFWKGGTLEGGDMDMRSPELLEFPQKKVKLLAASIWGMSFPWTLTLAAGLGVLCMGLPGILGLPVKAVSSDIFHLAGALVIVASVISMGEVARRLRYLNLFLALALGVVPWIAAPENTVLNISGTLAGVIIIVLSIPRGRKTEKYGMWDEHVT